MRTDLPQEFLAELARQGRKPRQLLEFAFASGTIYVSDQEYGSALANAYLPIVENWGELADTSTIEDVIRGTNQGTRQATVTLLNIGAIPFSSRFNDEAPENTEVSLYQWFDGTPESAKVLIDRFIVQDPIEYSEASLLLALDLVSLNQRADPYIGQLSTEDNNFYGVVIGSVSNAPGSQYGARPVVELAGDLSAAATTIACTSSPATAGFTAPGSIVIDFEQISYTGISGNSFTGCTRGVSAGTTWSAAFPHSSGQKVFKYNHEYLYSFGQGPLPVVGPVYVDGVVYSGPHTIYKDRNPVQVGFLHGDPWIKSTSSTAVTNNADNFTAGSVGGTVTWENNTSAAIQSDNGVFRMATRTASSWTINAVYAWQEAQQSTGISEGIASHAELVSAKVKLNGYQTNGGVITMQDWGFVRVIGVSGYWEASDSKTESGAGDFDLTMDQTSRGWSGAKTGYQIRLEALCQTNYSSAYSRTLCQLDMVRCEIQYKPYIKTHSTNLTCDLSSGTGNTNPADAITSVLGIIGIAGAIDAATFATAKTWFTTNGYSFNGFIPGDMRCREVLVAMCQQCRARLIYNGGGIKLIIRKNVADKDINLHFTAASTQQKSIGVARQSVRDVLNKVQIRYAATDVLASYTAVKEVKDQASIDKFGLQEAVLDFYLVNDGTMATALANFYIAEWANPFALVTFNTYLEAFPLEFDDVVVLHTEFSKFKVIKGDITGLTRVFGSGKNGGINLFRITIKASVRSVVEAGLADTIAATEQFSGTLDGTGYGAGGYGEGGYGA
ncbi:MAG: hypothetical protein C4563_06420 [Desulfobulbus sp.]|nr:MAG: hypothetical protein C4563_06420 [Desulfobulbus sp.]